MLRKLLCSETSSMRKRMPEIGDISNGFCCFYLERIFFLMYYSIFNVVRMYMHRLYIHVHTHLHIHIH